MYFNSRIILSTHNHFQASFYTVVTLCCLFFFSCSRTKDTFINRNWHNVTTRNNVLFNGQEAFKQGLNDISSTYKDDFWELLPIERMVANTDFRVPGEVLNQNFDKAEQKATKAIQRHSMLIKERERNPKMDESFLLLGKARYFEKRFIPALEAFNYINYKYPHCNSSAQAKIWRAKTYMRLDNNEQAIEDLKLMLNRTDLSKKDRSGANAMIAQAFLNLKKKDSALLYISNAAFYSPKAMQAGRYYYIQGQLHEALGDSLQANKAYDSVIRFRRRTDWKYYINAQMAKMRNFDYTVSDSLGRIALEKRLKKLEKARENRPFLDLIYHHRARHYRSLQQIDTAVYWYKESLRKESLDPKLVQYNYKALADIAFDRKEYLTAGDYFDSTLSKMSENSRNYRRLRRKRDNLDDVIYYEKQLNTTDSILHLVSMSQDQQLSYFINYIDSLQQLQKDKELALEQQRKNQKRQELIAESLGDTGISSSGISIGSKAVSSAFYFYNKTTVQNGLSVFYRKYGKIKLKDNWKYETIVESSSNDENTDEDQESVISSQDNQLDPRYQLSTYIDKIPVDKAQIDSLQQKNHLSRYQLGIIYKEKFKEWDLAKAAFTTLIKTEDSHEYLVPAKYHLYQVYESLGDTQAKEDLKQDMLINHKDSRYTQVIAFPEKLLEKKANQPELAYQKVYDKYKMNDYQAALVLCEQALEDYVSDPIVSKFELLKAYINGRIEGFSSYKKQLRYILENYPQAPEAREAQKLYTKELSKMQSMKFELSDKSKNHKLIFFFKDTELSQANRLKTDIETILKELEFDYLNLSIDYYRPQEIFLVLHGRISREQVNYLYNQLYDGKVEDTRGVNTSNWNRVKKYYPKIRKPSHIISTDNYAIIQIHKRYQAYIDWEKEQGKNAQKEDKQGVSSSKKIQG